MRSPFCLTYRSERRRRATIQADTALQSQLNLTSTQIGSLIAFVSNQMSAVDGTGGIPAGFQTGLGDINGEGTGVGAALPANHNGNTVKIVQPPVRQLVPTTTTAYSQAVLTDLPMAYWQLGESSGAAATDASGNGNTGTYTGGYTLGQTGAVLSNPAGTAVALNGSSGYIDAGAGSRAIGAYVGTGASFECWYKTTSAARQAMGSNDASGLITFLDLNLVAPNTIRFYATDSAGNVLDAYATASSGVSLSDQRSE